MRNTDTLRVWAEDFILYKRGIGYVYEVQEHYLMNYVCYAEGISPEIRFLDKETVTGYLNTFSDLPGSLYNATAVLREFGKHLTRHGCMGVYVIPAKSSPPLDPNPPYFFTTEEIRQFFEACDTIEEHVSFPGRELVLPALFRLMYCCGLRCKEARTLLYENINLDECFLDILQSKGPKSRRIYISNELALCLKKYDESIKCLFPTRKYFFPHKDNACYGKGAIPTNFRRFWMKAFPDFTPLSKPRAYDFRHHFVWANLNRWAQEGLDVNVMLPYLARYMGHENIKSTLYYFRFVPDFFPVFADMSKPLEYILPEVPFEER